MNEMRDVPTRGALYRLGDWIGRHAKTVLVAWLVLLTVALLAATTGFGGENLFQRLASGTPEVAGEANEADDLLEAEAEDPGNNLTFLIYGVDPLDEQLTADLADLPDEIADVDADFADTSLELQDPREGLAALAMGMELPAEDTIALQQATAADGDGVLIVVTVDSDDDEQSAEAADATLRVLDEQAETVRASFPDAEVYVSSDARIEASYREVAVQDLERGEGIALPVALLIMVVVFGGFLAAGIPILGALVSIGAGLGSLFLLSTAMELDSMVINIVSLLGLGLAIDYGLLIISRFREEIAAVDDVQTGLVPAIARTVQHAGRTVLFSGTIFAASSLGLVLFEPGIMKAIGIATVAVVVGAILAAITFLPAVLRLIGTRLAKPGFLQRLLGPNNPISRLGQPAPPDGGFGKLARWAQRRPAIVTIGSLAILAFIASPVLNMVPTNDVASALPRVSDQWDFVDTLETEFPDAVRAQVELVVASDEASVARDAVEDWADQLAEDSSVDSIGTVIETDSYAAIIVNPVEGEERDVVALARADAPSGSDIEAWVTGVAAHDVDLIESVIATIPWAAGGILLFTFILLFLMTGSVVIPLKSLFIATFSLGSAAGILVWGFQEGHLANLLGFHAGDVAGVDVLVLTIILVLGFGLSMDYEVFLLGRITELRDENYPDREAIWRGAQGTGRIITSAAVIMVVVFLGFTVGELLVIKQMGTTLAFLVAVDATLIRMVLVPALMTWQEKIMWWSPKFMRPIAERFRIRH